MDLIFLHTDADGAEVFLLRSRNELVEHHTVRRYSVDQLIAVRTERFLQGKLPFGAPNHLAEIRLRDQWGSWSRVLGNDECKILEQKYQQIMREAKLDRVLKNNLETNG